jgi:hypothetical protein
MNPPSAPPAALYRVDDPLENFKLRLRIRELSRLQVPHEDPSERVDATFVVHWQQKIYSPWEIEDYVKHKNSSDGAPNVIANRKRLHRLDTPKQPVAAMLQPAMLFTYVDGDGYSAPDKKNILATYSADNRESYMAAATRHHVPDDDLSGRQSRVRERLSRERTCKSMHICLATDVNVKAPDQQDKATEHLLCTLNLYSDGLLEVSPDFSAMLEEPLKGSVTSATEQIPTNGMFASDKTAAVALRKGLRLGTFSLRSASGSDFEYTLENMNGIISPTEIDEFEKRTQSNDLARSLKLRGLRGPDSAWKQDPPKELFNRTVAINAELVSATGFSGRELFISYEVVCPDNWDLRTGNLNDGVASEDEGSEKSFSEQDEEEDVLFGRTQVATVHDSYGSPHYSNGAPGGSGDISMIMPNENIIWGTLFFVITCIAVILGPGYGFWIVPAIVIAIVLGTGTPGGGNVEVVRLSEKDRMNMNWGGKYDSHKEGFAPSFGLSAEGGGGGAVTEPVASFGHPMGMSFDVRDEGFETSLAPSGAYPVILIEVFSTQYFGGNTLEGYGYVPLSDACVGFKDFSVSTWRPIGSRASRLTEFFVGGNPVLHHPVFAEVPNKMSSSLSRFGVLSEGSGSVRFRINTLTTDPRKKQALQDKMKRAQPEGVHRNLGRRSVDDIVNHFKQVEALNKSMNKSGGIFTPKALSALGKSADLSASGAKPRESAEPLSSTARAERVSQILNRARNRVATLTASRDDSSPAATPTPAAAGPTRATPTRPKEAAGGRRLEMPKDVRAEEDKLDDEKDENAPLLGRPPIRKLSSRGESGDLEPSGSRPPARRPSATDRDRDRGGDRDRDRGGDRDRDRGGDRDRDRVSRAGNAPAASEEAETWDTYETPLRVRRSSPSIMDMDEAPLRDVRSGMEGASPVPGEDGAEASEMDPLISAPRSLSSNARLRQFQREKSLSGEVESTPELKPLRPLRPGGSKFSNPRGNL